VIHPANIAISDFTYSLPEEKIAVYPLESRDASKLLVYRERAIIDDVFAGIDKYLDKNNLLVFNNTRVIRARLQFNFQGKPIEIFCLEPAVILQGANPNGTARWNCLVGNLRSWKEKSLSLKSKGITLEATVLEKHPSHIVVDFKWQPSHLLFKEVLDTLGEMPIPPYLKRGSEDVDITRYQTVYAEKEGSVAAPTAGLHFTPDIIARLRKKGVDTLEVTLHVGAGTFKPVKSETMKEHEMHVEWICVTAETVRALQKHAGKQIIAVGTTSLRTIESLYWIGVKLHRDPHLELKDVVVGQWEPYFSAGEIVAPAEALKALSQWMKVRNMEELVCQTAILIAPPYQLKLATGLITNFHQPQSTLLLLVCAVVGDKWKQIYEHALTNDYRFLSYGDCSLLLK
jgi:S-adenosylmethionine:tRNA ribosyltransferase-isomerase